MPITYYVGGAPSYNPMSGAPQANAANQAQYAAVLNGYNAALRAQQLGMNNLYGQYQKGLGTVTTNIGKVNDQYNVGLSQAMAGIDRIDQGYQGVLGYLQGVGASEQTALEDQYLRAQAEAVNSMASRGLTNSTVYDTAQRNVLAEKAKSDIALMNTLNREYAQVGEQEYNTMQQGYAGYDQMLQAQAGAMAQGYQGYNALMAQGLKSQEGGYAGYQNILQNMLNFQGNVQTVPIQNQVIPYGSMGGGYSPNIQQQSLGARAQHDLQAYEQGMQMGGHFGATGDMERVLARAATNGTPFSGFLGYGVSPDLGGSSLGPSNYSQAYGYQ